MFLIHIRWTFYQDFGWYRPCRLACAIAPRTYRARNFGFTCAVYRARKLVSVRDFKNNCLVVMSSFFSQYLFSFALEPRLDMEFYCPWHSGIFYLLFFILWSSIGKHGKPLSMALLREWFLTGKIAHVSHFACAIYRARWLFKWQGLITDLWIQSCDTYMCMI